MSVADRCITLPDGSIRPAKRMTYRDARFVSLRLNNPDLSATECAKRAGYPAWMIKNIGRDIESGEVAVALQSCQEALVTQTLDAGLIDATEIHEYLTDAIRADWADIENDDGTFKPLSQWPEIWRRMKEKGDVEVEEENVRSHDGQDTGNGGWEPSGHVVRKVKIAFASRVKLLELAMKHKGVDAMVNPNDKLAGAVGDLASTIDRAMSEGRQRAAQRNRVIDVKSES